MTGRESDPDDGRPTGPEVEDELRILLHLAAPHLTAPDDRMARVRERAARTRRRRRTAALSTGLAVGLTAAVLAAAPALAPGPPGTALAPGSSGPVAPGSVPPGASASASPDAAPSASPSRSTGSDTGGPVRFPELDGVIIDIPPDWYRLSVPGTDNRKDDTAYARGYTASQPLVGELGCPTRNGTRERVCLADGALDAGGMLVGLTLVRDPVVTGEQKGQTGPLFYAVPEKSCVVQGGTRTLRGYRTVQAPSGPAVVELTACLRVSDAVSVLAVERILDSIRVTGGAVDAPTIAPE
ncbi:hypothetical protein ACFWOG_29700 [Kitasatospora sp. NPDC058406]|uniref:hypothetical protein n=1 Tax=Kitasatospora sp. NPDC058406 TaxID=3346483 RepID=UPI0036553100